MSIGKTLYGKPETLKWRNLHCDPDPLPSSKISCTKPSRKAMSNNLLYFSKVGVGCISRTFSRVNRSSTKYTLGKI